MGNRKTYFTFIFIFMCLILYFINYSLNSNISDQVSQYRKITRISNIVARTSHRFSQIINDTCQKAFEPQKISILRNNNWQKLDNASRLFLLSAYEDSRMVGSKFIRIIAMSKGQFSQRIFCRVWYQSNKSSVTEVEVQDLWVTSWDLAKPEQYYRPLLLSCPCINSTPVAVSVIYEPCQEPSNVFWLKPSKPNRKQNFAVCLKPLNYQQDLTSRLVEWLELQFILGADVVSVYKYHLHPRMMKVLESYAQSGRLLVHEHPLPDVNDQNALETLLSADVWQKRRHEMAIYNDCFYRHFDSHRFVVNLDLDEAIVPLEHDSWTELLDRAIAKDPRSLMKSASLAARNVYFFDSFPEDLSVPGHFHVLRHLHRSANFTPPGFAQKSFFATDLVLSVTNHYALKSLYPGTRTIGAIGMGMARLHHYRRSCPPKMEKECEDNYMKFWVKDTAILRFKDELMRNVNRKIKELNLSDITTEYQ